MTAGKGQRRVRLVCFRCERTLGWVEATHRGWSIDPGSSGTKAAFRWSTSPDGSKSMTYACRCGAQIPTRLERILAAAPRASEQDRHLALGASDYGLS